MRFLLLTILSASVLVSCGPQGSSKNSAKDDGPQREEDYVTNVRGSDLLDVAMDVPVEISGNQIIFKQSVNNAVTGVRISCNVAVNSGEAYTYRMSGKNLSIQTASGQSMNLTRVSGDNGSIVGSWSGKSNEGGMVVRRRLTFLTENRLVMRTNCES